MKHFQNADFIQQLVDHGAQYISDSDKTSRMICQYLKKSSMPITAETIQKQIGDVANAILQNNLGNEMLSYKPIFPTTKVGKMEVTFPTMNLVTRMHLPSENSYETTGESSGHRRGNKRTRVIQKIIFGVHNNLIVMPPGKP